ncbi:S8 family serine peptidase [Blastococcus sp. TF02A-26]|uniref:S8 family serine peptidase n=1 Tax=Blastococcus sp. TF02A-26 TaxID=2250577 RepID=UPI000DE9495A|nr:S8 family serine peptidase [Blastococcus sp. TF02A-26]
MPDGVNRRSPRRSGPTTSRWAVVAAVTAALSTSAPLVASPAAATQVCEQPPRADSLVEDVPWSQLDWDPAGEVWPFSTGAGVTVAILGTGVQASHPQLAGRVLPGLDLVHGGAADVDCTPSASGLAGLVVAGASTGVGLRGLAPDAQVLPIQVTEEPVGTPGDEPVDPVRLAVGLDTAVAAGAQVVLFGVVAYTDSPELAAAVARAVAAGVVVVAPVGDAHDRERDGETRPTPFVPLPAAYEGVLGVAAVDSTGLRLPTSAIGPYVDLAAPGGDVVSTGTTAQQVYSGTAPAAALVAATAALLVADPDLGLPGGPARVAAVADRLAATALPAPGEAGYGAGLLAPGRALTEPTTEVGPVAGAPYRPPPRDPAAEAAAEAREAADDRSTWVVLGVVGAGALAAAAGWALPRARRRSWRVGVRPPAAAPDEPPGFVPPSALFDRTDARS